LAPVRLLLVDDDETVLSGLSVILEAHEFEVTTASNVNEALKHIANLSFDVLLSDLHMPGAGDGLVVTGAMRHANPRAITLVLSANPDMVKATRAVLRMVDEVLLKPVKAGPIVETIQRRLAEEKEFPRTMQTDDEPLRPQSVEVVATLLERERAAIAQAWLKKMIEAGSLAALTDEEKTEHLAGAMDEIVYRLRYAQPMGAMTLFSMASLQHGARRRRQGLGSPVLVEEARALQVALFQTVLDNLGRIDLGQLPATLMAIADEVNAQLLQSLFGYEKEKPAPFTEED
jgi:DNA-binding NarL/FixJ family response regulator